MRAKQFHRAPFTVYDAAAADDADEVCMCARTMALNQWKKKKIESKLSFKYVHRHTGYILYIYI